MVSTSGHTLIPDDAVEVIKNKLLNHADLITPNIPEAQRLVDWDEPINTLEDMLSLAGKIMETYSVPMMLLKGGHLTVSRDEIERLSTIMQHSIIWTDPDEEGDALEVLKGHRKVVEKDTQDQKIKEDLVVDILVEASRKTRILYAARKVESTSTHGTGCTLSSALACAWAFERRKVSTDSERF